MILFDVLHSIGIHRDRAVGFHYVQAPLVDQHEAEETIILQLVGDIPGGSADKLVLIDITYHTTGLADAHQRIVRRMPRFLSRPSLIVQLHLQAPCEETPGSCTFYFNNEEWNEDDLFPRELQHGTYLKIEVTAESQKQECPPQHVPDKAKQKGPDTPHIHGPDHHHEATSFMQSPLQHQDQRRGPMSHSATFPSLAGRLL